LINPISTSWPIWSISNFAYIWLEDHHQLCPKNHKKLQGCTSKLERFSLNHIMSSLKNPNFIQSSRKKLLLKYGDFNRHNLPNEYFFLISSDITIPSNKDSLEFHWKTFYLFYAHMFQLHNIWEPWFLSFHNLTFLLSTPNRFKWHHRLFAMVSNLASH